eukprot:1318703-Pyramimonas_sp.AAC.1
MLGTYGPEKARTRTIVENFRGIHVFGLLEPSGRSLGPSRGSLGPSAGQPKLYWGRLWVVLGPSWAVLKPWSRFIRTSIRKRAVEGVRE